MSLSLSLCFSLSIYLSIYLCLSLVDLNCTHTWKGTPLSSARWNKRGVSFCRIIVQTITRTQEGEWGSTRCICYSVFVGGGTEGQECPLKGQTHRPNACPVRFDGLLERSGSSRRDSFVSNNFPFLFSFFFSFFPPPCLYSVSFIDLREMLDCCICAGRSHESMWSYMKFSPFKSYLNISVEKYV